MQENNIWRAYELCGSYIYPKITYKFNLGFCLKIVTFTIVNIKKYFSITLLSCLSCPNLATTFFRLNGQCLAGKENFGSRCCLHCLFSSFLPPIFCLLKWSYYTTMYTILEGGLRLIWGKVYIRLAFRDNTQEFFK